ncbi:MAG TPA: ATP-grasp domain-containing protein, partial [Candidatus Paceibacterota bacterium]
GSGSLSSAISMNKLMTKDVFKKNKIKTPEHKVIDSKDKVSPDLLKELFRSFTLPFVVKSISSGSSVGVYIVKDFNSFEKSVNDAFKHSDTVMIEEYIAGREATVGVIDGFRNQDIYTLPAVEIRPLKSTFFDYDAKYTPGMSEEIVPSTFDYNTKIELENMAREIHKALGLRHYSRIDFIVTPRRGIFALEANTLPGLTEASLLPKALYAVGGTMPEFLHHVLQLALEEK